MGDQVLLAVAEEGDELVAGALNLIGGDTVYGRLWGCHPRAYYPSLHFEACYYQVWVYLTYTIGKTPGCARYTRNRKFFLGCLMPYLKK